MVAPHALLRLLLPALRAATGRVLTLSSDAAVTAYPGWGGYGASKAALDQLAAVLGVEEPLLLVYAVDPGDMRTAMHAAAFPGEDISDRPEPETVIPALRRLVDGDLPNGRYEAATLFARGDAGRPDAGRRRARGRGAGVGMTAAAVPAFAGLAEGAPATTPPEARGIARDGVRMLVASAREGLHPTVVRRLPAVLRPGDLVVLNTSDTLPAALRAVTTAGEPVAVHLSTVDPASGIRPDEALRSTRSRWVVELRRPTRRPGGEPALVDRTGVHVATAGARLHVTGPYVPGHRRLWTAELSTPEPLGGWLAGHGEPVRYGYTAAPWPLSAYRTAHADTPGSAEMPSAGRPITARVLRNLRRRGIDVATVVLHCGLSSPDRDEPPYAEWFVVPPSTLDAVARADRVIAIGTTVVRALSPPPAPAAPRAGPSS